MSSEELDESQRALRAIDNDSVYNISDILSKLQRGNQKIQNKMRERKQKQLRNKWNQLAAQMCKRSIQLEYNREKHNIEEEREIERQQALKRKEEEDLYAQEERLRREREAQVTKSASEYVRRKNYSIEIDIDDDQEEEEDEDEEQQVTDRELYSLIEKAFFPPKTKSRNKTRGNDISKDIDNLDLAFLQKDLDESTNKFMFNVLFGDAFKQIIYEQSRLADQSLKKCVTEKTMDRFKSIGPMLEGAANQ